MKGTAFPSRQLRGIRVDAIYMSNVNLPESVLASLDSLFADGRCPHAVLIDGSSEVQREALANLTAKMVVCSNQERTPCGACENCRKADEGIHPDIICIKKPEDKKSFVKADVKKMVADAYLTPNDADKKVYIISEIQNMNEESQNLLLKILEEPPRYTAFVLTSQTSNAVIGTVLSRVVRLRLGEIENNKFSDKAIDVVKMLCKAVCSPYEYDKVKATAPLDGNKKLTSEVLVLFTSVLRDAISNKSGGKTLFEDFRPQSEELCAKHNLKSLLDMYNVISSVYQALENNPNQALIISTLCARL